MPEKVGILRMQASRRWAICRPKHDPVEITSGEVFRVEVNGVLQVRRMEYAHDGRGYYAVGDPETQRHARGDRKRRMTPAHAHELGLVLIIATMVGLIAWRFWKGW